MKIVRFIQFLAHKYYQRYFVSRIKQIVSPRNQIVSPEKKIVSQSDYDELRVLRDNVYSLQRDLQEAYRRIKRLNDSLQRIATKEGKK
jgi:predicted  nucleic acid-binding Zn-ribbon protein